MYSDNEKQFSGRRSGDEFLRRFQGDDFLASMTSRKHIPTFAQDNRTDVPQLDERPRTLCNGLEGRAEEGAGGSFNNETDQVMCKGMPSLAMVYSPVQAFHKILTPANGLAHGSIFEELILPFEGDRHENGCKTGGCNR